MKRALLFLQFLFLITGLLFISCGTGKKLTSSEAKVDKLKEDSIKTQNQLKICNSNVSDLNDAMKSMQSENDSVKINMSNLSAVSRMTLAYQAKRLKNLQNTVKAQNEVITTLKTITEVLTGYKNDTAEGFAGNRRTEIILSPDLKEIYRFLNKPEKPLPLTFNNQ